MRSALLGFWSAGGGDILDDMTVSPLPREGATLIGRDRAGRTLRIASHPESSRVVLSVWQDGTCQATVRLAPADVADLVAELARVLVPADTPAQHSRVG